MADVIVTATEFSAFQADIDERFTGIQTQMEILSRRIAQALESNVIAAFPTEEAQIREKVMSAFQDEFATLLADINKIKSDIVDLKAAVGIEE